MEHLEAVWNIYHFTSLCETFHGKHQDGSLHLCLGHEFFGRATNAFCLGSSWASIDRVADWHFQSACYCVLQWDCYLFVRFFFFFWGPQLREITTTACHDDHRMGNCLAYPNSTAPIPSLFVLARGPLSLSSLSRLQILFSPSCSPCLILSVETRFVRCPRAWREPEPHVQGASYK